MDNEPTMTEADVAEIEAWLQSVSMSYVGVTLRRYYIPNLIAAWRASQARIAELEAERDGLREAVKLLEAYHYRIECAGDMHYAGAYTCRICGGSIGVDQVKGESLADAVAQIPHGECFIPSVRKLAGNPWAAQGQEQQEGDARGE